MEELADDAAHEADRQEHRDDRQRGGQHRQADLLRAVERRVVGGLAHLHMAHDVLAHHDRVVDQQADAQRQRHQRDHVDREAEHVMNKKVPISAIGSVRPVITVERHEFRNRNTIRMVSSAPSIRVRRTLSTATRIGREASAMGSSRTPGGSCGADVGAGLRQPVDHRDGVLVLRLLHRQQQGALAVVEREAVDFLRAIAHARRPGRRGPARRPCAPR